MSNRNIIWPFSQNPEPPEEGEHYWECDHYNVLAEALDVHCICDELMAERRQEAAERRAEWLRGRDE